MSEPAVVEPPSVPTYEDTVRPAVSTRRELDQAIAALRAEKARWTAVPIDDRRAILKELIKDFASVAGAWAEACREAEGLPPASPQSAEEWLAGPYFVLRNLHLLDEALADIERFGRPRIPGAVHTREDGRVVAEVFPQRLYDRIFYGGITADVWMQPGVTEATLPETQALAYRRGAGEGAVCLVLGAGNVSSIGPMDALYKLFVDDEVVLFKTHPLNAYLGPLLSEGFQALIDWGVFRIVHGGAEVGAYLCDHPDVDSIHITGSDRTVEAIVFGPGEEGARRKAERRPRLEKPITSELGNVSPVVVVPGPWSEADIAYQAENLVAMLVNNAGFNCNAARVIVTQAGWAGREPLLDAVRACLAKAPTRRAYYPGAGDRDRAFVAAHPEAERFGDPDEDELPWTLIPGVDASGGEDVFCFQTEAFCGLFAETALAAEGPVDFLAKATTFCNEALWGTLNATLLIHPKTAKQRGVAEALDRAIDQLRYGTVSVNNWAAIGYGLVITPWGAYPGHELHDIQSGSGVVHNTLMFSRSEKTVIRSPWRMRPKPMWFPTHRTALEVARRLTAFEATPTPLRLPGILWAALRG